MVRRLETNFSSVNTTVRSDCSGEMLGRLDVPRWIARRSASRSWPRRYPTLVSSDSPLTPENQLASRVMKLLLIRLSTWNVTERTAEGVAARWYRKWLRGRLKRYPWIAVRGSGSIQRLHLEASRRVARRQTGNELAYGQLVRLVRGWHLIGGAEDGGASSDAVVDGLLSFPSDESFSDRIFEIWCIRAIGAALVEVGATLIAGPAPLTNRRVGPIYAHKLGEDVIEVWFQRSLPSAAAGWRYEQPGGRLRGAPDISVIGNGVHYLLVDAKNRVVAGNTRSEETYKMLGYFENFRAALPGPASWGVLSFLSFEGFGRTLLSESGQRIELVSAHPTNAAQCTFSRDVAAVLRNWCSTWQDRNEPESGASGSHA